MQYIHPSRQQKKLSKKKNGNHTWRQTKIIKKNCEKKKQPTKLKCQKVKICHKNHRTLFHGYFPLWDPQGQECPAWAEVSSEKTGRPFWTRSFQVSRHLNKHFNTKLFGSNTKFHFKGQSGSRFFSTMGCFERGPQFSGLMNVGIYNTKEGGTRCWPQTRLHIPTSWVWIKVCQLLWRELPMFLLKISPKQFHSYSIIVCCIWKHIVVSDLENKKSKNREHLGLKKPWDISAGWTQGRTRWYLGEMPSQSIRLEVRSFEKIKAHPASFKYHQVVQSPGRLRNPNDPLFFVPCSNDPLVVASLCDSLELKSTAFLACIG